MNESANAENNKRKRSATGAENGEPPPRDDARVRFQVEDQPAKRRSVIPSSFQPVQHPCVVDPSEVAAGRQELWLIQLPLTTLQSFGAAESLVIDLGAHGEGPAAAAGGAMASFTDEEGVSYKLLLEAADVSKQLVVVCPLSSQDGEAQAVHIARRLTLVQDVALPEAGSSAGEAEDEAAALARMDAVLATMAAAQRQAGEETAVNGGNQPQPEKEMDKKLEEKDKKSKDKDKKDKDKKNKDNKNKDNKDKDKKDKDKDKDKKDKDKKDKDKKDKDKKDKDKKDKDKDKERRKGKDVEDGKSSEQKREKSNKSGKFKTPAAPPAAAVAAVKKAPATAPPAMRPLEGTATPAAALAPSMPAPAPAAVDGPAVASIGKLKHKGKDMKKDKKEDKKGKDKKDKKDKKKDKKDKVKKGHASSGSESHSD